MFLKVKRFAIFKHSCLNILVNVYGRIMHVGQTFGGIDYVLGLKYLDF